MLEKIKQMELSLILSCSFLAGLYILAWIFIPSVALTVTILIGGMLSVHRIVSYFVYGK